MISNAGLIVFIMSVLVSLGLLIFDLKRSITNEQTITEWVVQKWYRIVLVIGATIIGPIGLLVHFLTFD